ncbi:MAG: ferritin [Candidatus Eisenbacteria bacterium]|nr:ferritin [Candidatus Eisenbacteria bacterium]
MLISEKLARALSVQVGNEFGASLQYVMLASYFEREALPVLAARFYEQADEERMHAMKISHYVNAAGGTLEIQAIPKGKADFASAEEGVQLALDWELTVTRQINDLVGIAIIESDHLAQNFLVWFVNEQLEEVSSMDMLLKTIQRAKGDMLRVEEYVSRSGAKAPESGLEPGA